MEHTPEPWTYEFDEYGGYDCMTAGYIIQARGQIITIVDIGSYKTPIGHDDSTPWPKAEANAKLIAAAPDLLKACLNASNSLRAYLGGDLSKSMANKSEELLQAAISKATQ